MKDIFKNLNQDEIIKRSFKYFIEWFAIALALKFIPSQQLNIKDILMVSIVGAVVFAILDMYSPSVSEAARKSVGIAIGVKTLTL